MEGWVRQTCDACGRPAEVQENAAIYKCAYCGNVYERIRQASGEYIQVALGDAMTRLLSATEFVKAKALVDSLPRFISEAETELTQAQADLVQAQNEETAERARVDKAMNSRRDNMLWFGGGAVVALILAAQTRSPDSPLLWIVACIVAAAGAWWNYNSWQQMRSAPNLGVRAAVGRVKTATTRCAEVQEEVEQARLHLKLRESQVKTNIRQEFARPRKT